MLSLFTVPARAAVAVESYDKSPIESDMANMDEANYPANALGECSIIGFSEYCYSENSAYSSVYGLYVYVYNPTEKPLMENEGYNQISISDSFNAEGKADTYYNAKLTYLDKTDNNRFYKFKVTDSSRQYTVAKNYSALWNGKRRYEITSLDVHHAGQVNKDPSVGVSKIYEFTGYAAWCGEAQIAVSTLECQYFGKQDIHLEVHDTNYRFSEKGDDLYDDLQSVYISIPNEYYAQWGDLTDITAEWYEYRTAPMFVTSDSGAYSALFEMRNKRINEFGQLIDENGNILDSKTQSFWRVLWDESILYGSGVANSKIMFGQTFNGKCRDDIDDDDGWDTDESKLYLFGGYQGNDESWIYLEKLDWLFYVEGIESRDDYDVSSEEVKEYIRKYANSFPNQEKIRDKYPIELFDKTTIADAYRNHTFNVNESFEYKDQDKGQSAWNEFWFGKDIDTFNYSPIVTISEGDLVLGEDSFSEKYFVNKNDSTKIIEFAKSSYDNNETPVLLRFALKDYYASNARYDFAEEDAFDMSGNDGYVAQEWVYLDFDILSMAFTNPDGYNKTVIGVVADSIDIINGLTAPEDIPIEEEEWWQKIMMVLGLIVIFVLLLAFGGPISFVLKVLWDLLKVALKVILSVISIPFKILGWLFNPK